VADVVPFDGIGGNPGCPVWQVAYIVIARQMWKHYGPAAVPVLQAHWDGLLDLMGWFDRHADKADGLLTISCYGRCALACACMRVVCVCVRACVRVRTCSCLRACV
jgi:hypothetical protein